jgi:hypothetical protein
MNSYEEMKNKHQEEINAFPFGWAFNQKQFEEMMAKFGLKADDYDKIYSIGNNGFIRKTDSDAMDEMFARHKAEQEKAIADDTTGDGFICDMFSFELQKCDTEEINQLDAVLDAVLV